MIIILTLVVLFGLPIIIKRIKSRGVMIALLVCYIAAVLIITLASRSYNAQARYILDPFREFSVIFRSVSAGWKSGGFSAAWQRLGWYRTSLTLIVLNILILVPLGYLVPKVFFRTRRWWKMLLIGFAVSLIIESVQLFAHLGTFDTADLLHNTVGAIIGYGIFYAFGLGREE